MATSIIEKGPERYVTQCARCGCRFGYGLEDVHRHMIRNDGVSCPQCGDHCVHADQRLFRGGK